MEKRTKLYEGKAKILYETDDPNLLIQYFKDAATAFNALKKGTIVNKGILNNQISSFIFQLLEREGVKTHYVQTLNEREMLVKRLKIFPLEVVVRNILAGSLAKKFNLEEGRTLPFPILEFYYKDDSLGDPLIIEDHIRAFGWAAPQELEQIKQMTLKVNQILSAFLLAKGILLVDFKLEFGAHQGEILLGDEFTPDGSRLWDAQTGEKMDKDRFRRDLGKVEEAYQEVCRRITG
ncbi:MAG: phosphoribosylaminoimidazolesuccinocarboxamide synthase [Candidatus Schekmanbacteria bacterium]|nr:phosphoribosylaminoimidazolesuccinocarboxamide synthase [Candidatus Schekmanbacteria bacterium]